MGRSRRMLVAAAVTLLFAHSVGDAAASGAGAPDSTYGRNGEVVFDVAGFEYPTAMAVFPDGARALGIVTERELVIVKVTAGGAPDPSFGSDGTLRPLPGKLAAAAGMFATPEGGLLIAAWVGEEVGGVVVKPRLALVKLRANGTRDLRFGQRRGLVMVARDVVRPLSDHPLAAAMMRDGGVVVLGVAGVSLGYFGFPAATGLVRFGPNGHVDPSFGAGGFVPVEVSPVVPGTFLMAVDSKDRVVVATTDHTFLTLLQTLRVLRLTPRGRPDLTFGRGGVRPFTLGGDWNNMTALTVDNRDRVLVAGFVGNGVGGSVTKYALRRGDAYLHFAPAIVRLTERGSLDASFSGDGLAVVDRDQRGRELVFSDALTTDAVGRPIFNSVTGRSLSLIRLTTGGNVDASFDQPALPIDSWIRLGVHRDRIIAAGYRKGSGSGAEKTVIAAYLA